MDDARRHTDEAVGQRIRAAHARGDAAEVQDAFIILQARYQDRTCGHVRSKLADRDRADDIVQDVFLALFDAIVAGTEIVNMGAWMRRVTANHIADHYRSREGVIHRSMDDAGDPVPDPREEGPEDFVVYLDVVEQVLATLKDAHARVVELNLLEGWPAADVSRLTGESASNVYQIVRRFRVALLAALDADHPIGDED